MSRFVPWSLWLAIVGTFLGIVLSGAVARREWATSCSLLKDVLEASDSRNDFRTDGP